MARNVYLCPGDQFSIMCSTNDTLLKWTVDSVPDVQYGISIYHYLDSGSYNYRRRITMGGLQFYYIRNSGRGALPITSTIVINSVTINISGTRIRCRGSIYNIFISETVINGINT